MLTKILYGITALILALALSLVGVQTVRLSKAQNRAVEAQKLADGYKGSLESLERAVASQAKAHKAVRDALENRAKQAEAQAAMTKKENHDLQQALTANPDWTKQPIPPGVLDAIRN